MPPPGLEPGRRNQREILSLLCLPIPPWRRWRKRWDSNPRDAFTSNGLVDRRFQPLSHASYKHNILYYLPEVNNKLCVFCK